MELNKFFSSHPFSNRQKTLTIVKLYVKVWFVNLISFFCLMLSFAEIRNKLYSQHQTINIVHALLCMNPEWRILCDFFGCLSAGIDTIVERKWQLWGQASGLLMQRLQFGLIINTDRGTVVLLRSHHHYGFAQTGYYKVKQSKYYKTKSGLCFLSIFFLWNTEQYKRRLLPWEDIQDTWGISVQL